MTTTKLTLSPLFTDGAVLCRGKEIRVFGEASGGTALRALLLDADGHALADHEGTAEDGRFLITLPPQEARTGCRLVVSGGETAVTAEDVAIGDVYLAGGQSNMEMELRNSLGGTGQAKDDPLLRFFNVPRKAVVNEEQRKEIRETRWKPVSRETAGYNSAVATIFGQEMRRRHPDVPVGIIGCYWGGTSVTCWMDEETLQSLPEGRRYLEEDAGKSAGKTMEAYLAEEKAFQDGMAEWGRKAEEYKASHPGTDDRELEKVLGPFPWNPPAGPGSPYRPAGLAESMLKEISPVTLTAALYYQGEEDTGRTEHYDRLMEAMIRFWRGIFREPELPFLFVQLPMWIPYDGEDTRSWARTRLAQASVRDTVAGTGMICLLDEGEYGNIHPVNKQPVGLRLAELACRMMYGEGEESPRVTGYSICGDTIVAETTQNLKTPDGKAPRLLEIAGEDGAFVPAEGVISGNRIRIRSERVKQPVSVRYAWTDWSDQVNIFGGNGLPLEPFRLESDTVFEQIHG